MKKNEEPRGSGRPAGARTWVVKHRVTDAVLEGPFDTCLQAHRFAHELDGVAREVPTWSEDEELTLP